MYKVKRFSKELDKLIPKSSDNIENHTLSGSNLIKTNLPDGVILGDYDDFCFIPEDEKLKEDKRYRLSFNSSSFGDSEFKAIVEIKDGIAAIYKYEDYKY